MPAIAYRTRQPASRTTLVATVHNLRPPVKFDAAFLERRLAEHRAWQEQQMAEDAAEIISEVAAALDHVSRVRNHRAKRLTQSV